MFPGLWKVNNDLTHVREYKVEQFDNSDIYSIGQLHVSYKEALTSQRTLPRLSYSSQCFISISRQI